MTNDGDDNEREDGVTDDPEPGTQDWHRLRAAERLARDEAYAAAGGFRVYPEGHI